MKVRYTRRASHDLESILSYIGRDDVIAAERVRRAIVATIKMVSLRPYIGIRNARAPELRSRLVPRYLYRVHYALRDQEIVVLHIRHGARAPWTGEP
jgi:plasmid stabilization system protein ParE